MSIKIRISYYVNVQLSEINKIISDDNIDDLITNFITVSPFFDVVNAKDIIRIHFDQKIKNIYRYKTNLSNVENINLCLSYIDKNLSTIANELTNNYKNNLVSKIKEFINTSENLSSSYAECFNEDFFNYSEFNNTDYDLSPILDIEYLGFRKIITNEIIQKMIEEIPEAEFSNIAFASLNYFFIYNSLLGIFK